MSGHFEARRWDGAGRLGRLSLSDGDRHLSTPALLPVINPNHDTIDPAALVEEFDPEGLITNAYVIYQHDSLRDRAETEGVHGLLGVEVPVMTDSGSFQLATYGEIDVTSDEIVAFQDAIGSDICTPVDVPTHPEAPRDRVESDMATTLERTRSAADRVDGRLLSGPVQGGGFTECRERAGRQMRTAGADVYPIGAVVPLLENYRFATLVDLVVAAKRGLGPDAPVHLFGAGHPMMFALAVAMGCDLFDSAAYALFARDGRYLTVSGTLSLDDLEAFPCACPVCSTTDPRTVRDRDDHDRERLLARHNLHVSMAELSRIRQAIHDANLFELLERRARSHPAVLAGYRRLLDHSDHLERHDPVIKGSFKYLSAESARRPAVARHHRRLRTWPVDGPLRLLATDRTPDAGWQVVPPFGPVPPGLEHSYPLTAELPRDLDQAAYGSAVDGVRALLDGAADSRVTFVHDGWPRESLARLPASVSVEFDET